MGTDVCEATHADHLTIRALTSEEISLCLPGGDAFYAEIALPGRFSAPTFLSSWESFYQRDMGIIFGLFNGETWIGGLGGILAPDVNTGDLTAIECFWIVLPQYRGARMGIRLVQRFEDWARARGATHLIMVYVHGRPGNTLDKLYQRMGFRALETNYVKDL